MSGNLLLYRLVASHDVIGSFVQLWLILVEHIVVITVQSRAILKQSAMIHNVKEGKLQYLMTTMINSRSSIVCLPPHQLLSTSRLTLELLAVDVKLSLVVVVVDVMLLSGSAR